MYYKIEFKTHSMFVYDAITKIANRSNVVKRKITMNYDLVINTSKEHLYDDILKALENHGYTSADFTLTSTPYERKAPKKRAKTRKK